MNANKLENEKIKWNKELEKKKSEFFHVEQLKWIAEWDGVKTKLLKEGTDKINKAQDKLFYEKKNQFIKEAQEIGEKIVTLEKDKTDVKLKHLKENNKKLLASEEANVVSILKKMKADIEKEKITYIEKQKEIADKYLSEFYKKPTNVSSFFCSDKLVKNSCVIAIYKDGTGEVIRNGDFDESVFEFVKKRLGEVDNDPDNGKETKGKSVNMLVDFKTM